MEKRRIQWFRHTAEWVRARTRQGPADTVVALDHLHGIRRFGIDLEVYTAAHCFPSTGRPLTGVPLAGNRTTAYGSPRWPHFTRT